jgi:type IV pilus assembly protein PilB
MLPKREVKASREQLIESGLDPKRYGDYPFYEGKGCIDCNGTGYRGRTAIAELLDCHSQSCEQPTARPPMSEATAESP